VVFSTPHTSSTGHLFDRTPTIASRVLFWHVHVRVE
jgi:hypothetical protein